ncbi:MAG: glycosyltransferase family 2 protein [Pyrinomonadaceae bacterium]|nr:glycosyltransferase family 2 protein [Pyrinomonadaceae bacterium]
MLYETIVFNFVQVVQWFFLVYFIALNGIYLVLTIISLGVLPRFIERQSIHDFPLIETGFEPPISLVVTAYNEEAVIVPTIHALLQLEYPEYEIIIVNDGSKDRSMEILTEEFDLAVLPVAFRQRIEHKPVKQIYQSRIHPNLRVIDKENGGCKADASNAGINGAKFGLFMPLDADTILERNCLKLMVQPFLLNPDTVGVGGNVRILNGCEVEDGQLTRVGLPKNWLAMFQVLEYTRAFLSGRVGWNYFNALPLISGAFGLFKKEAVIEVGGYSHKSLGEDMDLVLRLHRHYRLNQKPYRLDFVVDPVCWTEAPETLSVLKKQRVRWQRGLFDCLWENRRLMFHPKGGPVGWTSFPFLLFLEGISPVIEVAGHLFFLICYFLGLISGEGALAFMLLSFGTGFLLSVSSIFLEEITFRTYRRRKDLIKLIFGAFIENFGYRQMMSFWRLEGIVKWVLKTDASWGTMTRNASWSAPAPSRPAIPPGLEPRSGKENAVAERENEFIA